MDKRANGAACSKPFFMDYILPIYWTLKCIQTPNAYRQTNRCAYLCLTQAVFFLMCFRYQSTWITPTYLTYQNIQPFPYCLTPFPFKHPIFFTKNTTFFLPSSSKYRALSNRWFKKTSLSSSEQWQAINSERSFDWRGHENFRNVSGLRSPTSLNIVSTKSGNFINLCLLLSCVMSWQR